MSFYGQYLPCARQTNGGQMNQLPMFPTSPAIGTTLPTGVPAGQFTAPFPTIPVSQLPTDAEAPTSTVESLLYTPGFMRTQIGRRVKVEFLIGTNMLVDREGTLLGVGASYILIQETDTDDILLCDLYSIKFAKFYY